MQLSIVSPYPPLITGIGQYGYHVSKLLARSNAFSRIVVLTGKSQKDNIPLEPSIQIEQLWEPNALDLATTIPARLKAVRSDLVWFNLGVSIFGRSPLSNLSGFLSVIRTKKLGFPTVVTLHEMPELSDLHSLQAPGWFLAKYGARLLTGIATQSDVTCLTIQRYVDWLSSRRSDARYLHIPMGAYNPPEMLPETDTLELLFFTTLAPFKGLELLLKAYEILQKTIPQLRLTIAGADHVRFPGYAQRLRDAYAGLTGVNWLWQVAEENVRALFQNAKIVVLPYLASTGASSVLAQAATWGRPVIASDLPEVRSLARENNFDVAFFQSGNVSSLVEVLKTQLETPEQLRTQVRRNFYAIQRYRPEETCHAYLRAFNLALETRHSTKRIALPAMPVEHA
jgi:glycosyltransferase involved in cell wall biosynthesis